MTVQQFRENEEKFKNRIAVAKSRLDAALEAYNAYKGNDPSEEHRLALKWMSASSNLVEMEKRLVRLHKDYWQLAQAMAA